MTAHIHAALMAQYAQDAEETETPWLCWQKYSHRLVDWVPLGGHPGWDSAVQYRRKPRTHMVNGIEVPAPMRDALKVGADYWVAEPALRGFAVNYPWNGDELDERHLERGLVHATKEAAVANAMAMIGRKS